MARTLALEVLLPTWPSMGLDFVDSAPLRRRALELLRDEDLDEVELPQRLGDAARTPHGADAASHFVGWAKMTWVTRFPHHPDWFALRRAAHRACGRPDRYKSLSLPGPQSRDFKRRFDTMMDMNDVEAQVASLRQKSLSDLDVEVCLRGGFDPHVPSLDFFGPIVLVSRMHRFQTMLDRVVGEYPEDALVALRHGLVATAHELKLDIDPPTLSELIQALPGR